LLVPRQKCIKHFRVLIANESKETRGDFAALLRKSAGLVSPIGRLRPARCLQAHWACSLTLAHFRVRIASFVAIKNSERKFLSEFFGAPEAIRTPDARFRKPHTTLVFSTVSGLGISSGITCISLAASVIVDVSACV